MSRTATLSWKEPRPTAGGYPVPEGADLPRMRPRRKRRAQDKDMVRLLDDALEGLARTPCTFWACDGPNKPRPMCTCCKCYAMRAIGTARETLAAREQR